MTMMSHDVCKGSVECVERPLVAVYSTRSIPGDLFILIQISPGLRLKFQFISKHCFSGIMT